MKNVLHNLGSLWLGTALLMLLAVALACATLYESSTSTERALADFYHAWWFEGLLAIVAVSILVSLVVRFPYHRRQAGFVMTHGGLLLILAGALLTQQFGIDGRLGVIEGQTVSAFSVPQAALTLSRNRDEESWSVDLHGAMAGGFEPMSRERAESFRLGDYEASILQYLPDSRLVQRITNDSPRIVHALQILPEVHDAGQEMWLFQNSSARLGSKEVSFRVVEAQELLDLLLEPGKHAASSAGTVTVMNGEQESRWALEDCLGREVQIPESPFKLKVLRYLPHATVGADNTLHNQSDQPLNPAIEVELIGPQSVERRIAFARFPDFQSMHGASRMETIRIRLESAGPARPETPISLLCAPDDKLYVGFREGTETRYEEIGIGRVVKSPWPGSAFTVVQHWDHAQSNWEAEARTPVRESREPAIQVLLKTPDHQAKFWLQKHRPLPLSLDGVAFQLAYGDKTIPLDFQIKLNHFRIGTYPGTRRPRSFESHITIVDPADGSTQDRVISMNHPTAYKGYTFYQSSYRMAEGQTASFLSVSRDPGMFVVFGGYFLTMLGMAVVLGIRIADRRYTAEATRKVVHLQLGGSCQSS